MKILYDIVLFVRSYVNHVCHCDHRTYNKMRLPQTTIKSTWNLIPSIYLLDSRGWLFKQTFFFPSFIIIEYFLHVVEVKWKRFFRNIAAMWSKQWKQCYRAMKLYMECQYQPHPHHFQLNRHFPPWYRPVFSIRPLVDIPYFNNNSSSNNINDSWRHHTPALGSYRQLFNPNRISRNRMEMEIDAAVAVTHKNDYDSMIFNIVVWWDMGVMDQPDYLNDIVNETLNVRRFCLCRNFFCQFFIWIWNGKVSLVKSVFQYLICWELKSKYCKLL